MGHNSGDRRTIAEQAGSSTIDRDISIKTGTPLGPGAHHEDSENHWLAVLRSLIYTPIYLTLFLILMLVFLFVSLIPGTRFLQDLVIRTWAWCSLYPFGVRWHFEGLENVPKTQGFLYLFNHQSHFDIPVCYVGLPRSMRFGAKIELYRIPIFGSVLRRAGSLPIARQNRDEVFKVYEAAKMRVAKGEVFILAPEGTRQETPVIGPFKKGPFILAVGAEMPIVPVVLYGVHDVLPKGQLLICAKRRRQQVWAKVLPAIETKGRSLDEVDALAGLVREQMVEAYAELAKKNDSQSRKAR
jgi:1-acyl-sn-glycerol-3-phosphate acyltransferase